MDFLKNTLNFLNPRDNHVSNISTPHRELLTAVDHLNETNLADHTTPPHLRASHPIISSSITNSLSLSSQSHRQTHTNTHPVPSAIFTPVMLGDVLCERPKHWCLGSPISVGHYGHRRLAFDSSFPIKLVAPAAATADCLDRRCIANGSSSAWHDILPAGNDRGRHNPTPVGEGSWNVAWDVRPARWLNRPHTAWILFGICAYLAAPPVEFGEIATEPEDNKINGFCTSENSANYRIIGVPADGRCLFRAIAHMVCLRNGEEAPDEIRQKELADELRIQVVDEIINRRKETEWFIEGDFDAYVKRIQKPFVWGGEPELLMASHVLKTTISVFMLEKVSTNLLNIATYGKEYQQADKHGPIKVLFHGYGHYDILEDVS